MTVPVKLLDESGDIKTLFYTGCDWETARLRRQGHREAWDLFIS
jgi:hypothetical protein